MNERPHSESSPWILTQQQQQQHQQEQRQPPLQNIMDVVVVDSSEPLSVTQNDTGNGVVVTRSTQEEHSDTHSHYSRDENNLFRRHHKKSKKAFRLLLSKHVIPPPWEYKKREDYDDDDDSSQDSSHSSLSFQHQKQHKRVRYPCSIQRRLFLILTEPKSSQVSVAFFAVLVLAIFAMNAVMILQTMSSCQFTPTDCRLCGGSTTYLDDDQGTNMHDFMGNNDDIDTGNPGGTNADIPCECPPTPKEWTVQLMNWLVFGITAEWLARVLVYTPPAWDQDSTRAGALWKWFRYLTCPTTILDALAVFPYYIEMSVGTHDLMALRLLRLFRVLQLVRLGHYSSTFHALLHVLLKSTAYLQLMVGVLMFGAALFGSMVYWLEKGNWAYDPATEQYQYMRADGLGNVEISPFTSIPASFWWLIVTATSVGYGDMVPFSPGGKTVASLAMILGVLVVAFPVSIFTELWRRELRRVGAVRYLHLDELNEDGEDDSDSYNKKDTPKTIAAPDGASPAASISPKRVHALGGGIAPDIDDLDGLEAHRYHHNPPPPPPTTDAQPWSTDLQQQRGRPAASIISHSTSHQHYRRQQNSEFMAIHKDDWIELISLVNDVQESQRQIRSILRKYRMHPTADA
jgi:hypothetical protein